MAYAYEPELIRFKHRLDGRVVWRGPHRFYHPADIHPDTARWHDPDPQPGGPPVQMLGVMSKRFSQEIWPWLGQQGLVGFEGHSQRSLWCRARAFQFIFRRDEDAFAFKMRFG